jgi:hypothetical protein
MSMSCGRPRRGGANGRLPRRDDMICGNPLAAAPTTRLSVGEPSRLEGRHGPPRSHSPFKRPNAAEMQINCIIPLRYAEYLLSICWRAAPSWPAMLIEAKPHENVGIRLLFLRLVRPAVSRRRRR